MVQHQHHLTSMKFLIVSSFLLAAKCCTATDVPFSAARHYRFPYDFMQVGHQSADDTVVARSTRDSKLVNKSLPPTTSTAMDDFDLAEDALFRAVENTEKAALNALRDEVDFMFCHPGDVHHGERTRPAGEMVQDNKTRREKKKEECLSKAEHAKRGRVLSENMRQCIDEVMMGNLE